VHGEAQGRVRRRRVRVRRAHRAGHLLVANNYWAVIRVKSGGWLKFI
jgi:hypothetical protein